MIYVPQYTAPTPEGFRDVDFDHFYDALPSSGPYYLPQLALTVGDPNPVLNIPLRIDPDAPFIWRGIKIGIHNIGIRLRDPWGNFLCPDNQFVPMFLFSAAAVRQGTGESGPGCVIEPETECPPQSVIYVDLFSFEAVPWTLGGPNQILLTGVKRYRQDQGCTDGGLCG